MIKVLNYQKLNKVLPDDEDLRILTYKTLLEKFNQKYTKLSGSKEFTS